MSKAAFHEAAFCMMKLTEKGNCDTIYLLGTFKRVAKTRGCDS